MIVIHGHFYQPPREDPWLEIILPEPTAAPYRHWDERISYECYEPNAILGNYAWISFDFGPTLLDWLRRRRPHVYKAIIEADKVSAERWGHGNAIAHPYYHVILPLVDRRNKEALVAWGIKYFEKHFEREPEGMWLPEMAVDYETLDVLADYGVRFVVLTQRQVRGGAVGGPYKVVTKTGREIYAFVRDERLSDALSFGDVAEWPKLLEGSVKERLTLVVTDGETFGHHKRGGDKALANLVAKYAGELTNLGAALEGLGPMGEIEIIEGTSWSCPHGLGRWTRDCGCDGPAPWREPLRQTIDWVNDVVDAAFDEWGKKRGIDPWALLRRYVEVVMGKNPAEFLRELAPNLQPPETLKMLEMERAKLAANSSDAWFFARLGLEAGISVRWALRALELLGNQAIIDEYVERLRSIKGEPAGDASMFIPAIRGPLMAASMALASHIVGYTVEELGPYQLALNGIKIKIVDKRTLESWEIEFTEFGIPVLKKAEGS
ncbi:MAG: DUF3536 domain-containing protein [Thermoproteus sp. AZ2]|uniref:DUF3536 domain-containing protein n=1 Tax=Thermoproteus sp. AZ2 TaxID=1609232 RepID=A0ACC6UZY6_9CREN|nr:MAG: glycoside hydrolase [Thermoproteus sp. AZ2]